MTGLAFAILLAADKERSRVNEVGALFALVAAFMIDIVLAAIWITVLGWR